MNVLTVVDNDYGMLFHGRRLSQDEKLREKILFLSAHTRLLMSPYSAGQFAPLKENIIVSDSFLKDAKDGDLCFVEDQKLLPYAKRIDTFYLFFWNRRYPSDQKLDFIPQEHGMKLRKREDFAGNSHETITLEIWQK